MNTTLQLVETSVYVPRSITQMVAMLSKILVSTKGEKISMESLRKKYYDSDSAIMLSIEAVLQKLLDHSKKIRKG